ncbi:MAG TPA: hypothetical protein VG498_07935 [Terriglobales bacterium]|nr:hypothetical protein [Terriglobales bacterium]
MSRHLLFALLLASAVALAADKPKGQHADGAATQKKKEPTQGVTKRAQANTEPAQRRTEKAQAKTKTAQPATEEPQAQTEEAKGQAEKTQATSDEGAKLTSVPDAKALGMSILGNQDAPKSLVIVPWKSSELGDSPGSSPMLDDSRQPVDKEVFMRSLRYYEIRSKTKQ